MFSMLLPTQCVVAGKEDLDEESRDLKHFAHVLRFSCRGRC